MKKNKDKNKSKSVKEISFSENLIPAVHFGFKITEPQDVLPEDIRLAKSLYKEKDFLHPNLFSIEELVAILRDFKERDTDSMSPTLFAYEGVAGGSHNKHRKKTGEESIGLHIVGVQNSIAEAILIKTTQSILNDAGYKKIIFKMNDIGGKTSQNQFNRESTNYFRKYIANLSPDDRQLFKQSPYHLISQTKNIEDELFQNAPKPIDFLDDETRKNLSEVLEFLEAVETPYEVQDFLLGDPNYSSDTVFEVIDENTGKTLAYGTRYNLLARKIGIRKDVPAIGVLIQIKQSKKASARIVNKLKQAKLFLIQVGGSAKIKALKIIEVLRQAGLPIRHSIYRDKLSAQIIVSKRLPHDYLLIIGHKESIEDCVIVRDSQGRAQKTIKIAELVDHIKSLK